MQFIANAASWSNHLTANRFWICVNVKEQGCHTKGCHAGPRSGIHAFGVMDCGSGPQCQPSFIIWGSLATMTVNVKEGAMVNLNLNLNFKNDFTTPP